MSYTPCALAQAGDPTEARSVLTERVHLSADERADFNLALTSLASQAKILVAVEGEPLHNVLTAEQMQSFGAFSPNLSLQEAIIRVADTHGYSVAKWGNTFALSKRYDEPEDLPSASLEEMIASMDDVVRILKPFGAHGQTNTQLMAEIFESFTADQIRQLPKRTLTVSSLSPRQRDLVSEGAVRIYAGGRSQQADDVDYRLRHVIGASVGLAVQADIAPPGQAQPGGVLIRLAGEDTTRQIGRTVVGGTDPAANLDNEKAAVKTLSETLAVADAKGSRAADASTIETLVAKLNQIGGERFAVEPELKERKASLFGLPYASSDSAFRSLAFACGLSIRTENNGAESRIVRPRALIPTSVVDLPIAVRRALPVTFLRACGVTDVQTSTTFAAVPDAGRWLSAKGLSPRTPVRAENGQEMSLAWLLQAAATERIKARLILKLKTRDPILTSETPIKDSELDAETRSAVGVLILAEFVGQLDGVMPIRQQDFIAKFDEDVLGGGVRVDSRGRRKLDLEFLVARPGSTGLQVEGAIGDVLAPKTLPIDTASAKEAE